MSASFSRLIISLTLVFVVLAQRGPKRSKELTDKNFEHDTQATTGSTTGDWFVNFCTRQSRECREFEPLWDELAEKLYGRVSVAHLDLDRSKEIKERFNLKGVAGPKLWLFKRRRYYQYDGSIDDIEALHKFAIETYEQAKVQGDIPQEPGLGEKLWKLMLSFIEKGGERLNKIVMKNETEVNYGGVAVVYGIPLIIFIGLTAMIIGGREDSNVVDAIKKEGSPGLTQSTGKFDQTNTNNANANTLVSSFANGSMMSGSTAVPGNSAQKGQTNYLTFGSPDKSNVKTAQRRGSQARSGRSNSSRDSSGGGHRRRSINRSANRRSYSTDPDSTERSFVYPCQAFKQFLLTVREGKIDMKDLQNSPFLMDYLTMQAQMGGGSGGADSKPFHQTLRQQTKPTSNGRKNSSNSRGREPTHAKSQHGLRSIRKPDHSIVEELNEEDGGLNDTATVSTQNLLYGKSQDEGSRFSNLGQPSTSYQSKNKQEKSRSPIKHNFVNSSSPTRPNKTGTQSNARDNSTSQDRTTHNKQRPSDVSKLKDAHHQRQGRNAVGLDKADFKEDKVHQYKEDGNQSYDHDRSNSNKKNLHHQPTEKTEQVQQPSGKKQRRSRLDHSTSGDERNTIHVNLNDSQEEIRFDEKGRPIPSQKQLTTGSPMKTSMQSSPAKTKSLLSLNKQNDRQNYDDNNDNTHSLNNSFQSKNKNRRGRKDRGSSGSDDLLNKDNEQPMNPTQNSPFEPRSISKLPRPTMKEHTPQRSVQKIGNYTVDNANNPIGQITEGTFRDYQEDQEQEEEGEQTNSRIPIFHKNTDFMNDEDYRLDVFKNKDEQPKKFLKSRASPLKKHQFKEDEDHSANEYQYNQEQEAEQNEPDQLVESEEIQSEKGQLPTKQEDASKIGLSMIHKKSPSREKRKVQAGKTSIDNPNNLSGHLSNANSNSHLPYNIGNVSSQGEGIFGDNAAYFDSRNQNIDEVKEGQDSQRSQKFREFLEEQKQQQNRSRSSNISGVIGVGASGYSIGAQKNDDTANKGEGSNRFTNLDNSLNFGSKGVTKDYNQDENQPSSEKKQRRGRRNRSGRQSSDPSQERNAFPRTSQLEGIHSRTQDYRQSQSPDQQCGKPSLNMSLTKLSDKPLTIEEHIDTYRSKTSTQLLKSARKDYDEEGQGEDYKKLDSVVDQDQQRVQGENIDEYYQMGKDKNPNNNDYSTRHQRQSQSPLKSQSPSLQNAGSPYQRNDNNSPMRDYSSPTTYQNYNNNQNQAQEVGKNQQSLDDPSDMYNKDSRQSSQKKQRRGRKSRDRSNDSSMYQSQQPNLQDNPYQQDTYQEQQTSYQRQLEKQEQQISSQQDQEYLQQKSPMESHQSPYSLDKKNDNVNVVNNNYDNQVRQYASLDPLQEQKQSSKGQQERKSPTYQGLQQNQYSPNRQQSSTQNQKSPHNVHLRQERLNIKNEETKSHSLIKSKEVYKSKLKELEEKLRKQVLENPTKPLDYRLIQELQEEAARTIQKKYKSLKKQKQEEDEVRRHGNLCDRKVQTDPVNLYKLAAGNDMDKFKRLFFAVYYTYIMLNTIIGDSFKKQK